MPYVNSFDNTKIYYEITGDGFPLVLIIGLGGNSKAWAFQVPDFSKKYKIITIDNRGAGLSDKPDEYYSMKIFAKDIKAVLDNENIKNSYFLGLSMGGLILQEFYHSYPEYVKAMILGCTGPGDPGLIKQNPKVKEVLFSIEEKNYDNLIKERIKLFHDISSPKTLLCDVFDDMKIERVKINDEDLLKIICHPKKEDLPQITFFVAEGNYLQRRMLTTNENGDAYSAEIIKYSLIENVFIPAETKVLTGGIEQRIILEDFRLNTDIPDSEFEIIEKSK